MPSVYIRRDACRAVALAWSGVRGGVSLAAALAITTEGFPQRDLVIFVAYAVIVLTLVSPG